MKSLDEIAAALAGYDPQALPVDKVNAFLAQLVDPVRETQSIHLSEALGRVLASDVVSPFSVPPHDNSAMDGYALAGADLSADRASVFEVVGTALAGRAWTGALKSGQCVKIMTGAVMPAGLDTVVPQELCRALENKVEIAPGVLKPGDNRRLAGEDLMRGAVALQKGELLSPAALGLLASLNVEMVQVMRRPRVAYFSTGDELLSLGDAPREGAIYDSNRYTVLSLLKRWGFETIDMGLVRDEPAALEAAFKEAATQADALVTSGGVSVGEADHTKAMMKKLGDVAFWRIAMRPGRPMAVGQILNTQTSDLPDGNCGNSYENDSFSKPCILFGLPGNPVATMVTMLAFVRPALMRMAGVRSDAHCAAALYLQARSQEAIRKKPGRTEYQRGIVSLSEDGQLQVRCTSSNQGSGVLSSMVAANGLMVLHHAQGNINIGDKIDVMMFDAVI